jgi:hypothetical protein
MKFLSILKAVSVGFIAFQLTGTWAINTSAQRLDQHLERHPEFSFPISGDPRAITLKLKLIDADCAPEITLLEGQSGTHTLTSADGTKRTVSFMVTPSATKQGELSLMLIQNQITQVDGQIQNHFVTSLPAQLELQQPLRLMTAGVETAELVAVAPAPSEMMRKCTGTCCVPCGGGVSSCITSACGVCMTGACNGSGACCIGGSPPVIRR